MAKAIARTVADIMTRDVVCVAEEDNLLNLLESMHALRFRHTPITADGRLVGLLAERDLLRIRPALCFRTDLKATNSCRSAFWSET